MKRKKRTKDKYNKKNSRLNPINSVIKKSRLPKSKRSQQILGLSFGVIFSIILIIFFILITFIVIKSFLSTKSCAQLGIFKSKLENEVKNSWNSQYVSSKFKGVLPSKVKKVCFSDLSSQFKGVNRDIGEEFSVYEGNNKNMFFYPIESACEIPAHNIPHINLDLLTINENPYCINVENGIIEIQIEKKINDRLVSLLRF